MTANPTLGLESASVNAIPSMVIGPAAPSDPGWGRRIDPRGIANNFPQAVAWWMAVYEPTLRQEQGFKRFGFDYISVEPGARERLFVYTKGAEVAFVRDDQSKLSRTLMILEASRRPIEPILWGELERLSLSLFAWDDVVASTRKRHPAATGRELAVAARKHLMEACSATLLSLWRADNSADAYQRRVTDLYIDGIPSLMRALRKPAIVRLRAALPVLPIQPSPLVRLLQRLRLMS